MWSGSRNFTRKVSLIDRELTRNLRICPSPLALSTHLVREKALQIKKCHENINVWFKV